VTGRQENNIKNKIQGFKEKYIVVSREKGRMIAWQVNLPSRILMSE
jgi:hypothetical protein